MTAVAIPTKEEADWSNPEEHLVWALRNMPTYAGIGAVTHSGFLRTWSAHLVKAGCTHYDYLLSLADEDGNIHVSKLKPPTIKFQPAARGPRHQYNPGARWAPVDAPDPQPMRLQDVSKLTTQEQYAMADQLREAGVIPPLPKYEHKAQELND